MTVKAPERPPRSAVRAPRHAARPARGRLGPYAGALALIATLVQLNGSWAAQVLLVPLLLVVPGVILLRALRIPGRVVSSFPVYVPCASVVVLLGSGLAMDLIGPLIGVAAPLRPVPLLVSLEITCLVLLITSVNAPSSVAIPWHSLSRPGRLAWPLVLPLVAAAGALRLNSGHGDSVALIALAACIVILSTTVMLCRRLDKTLLVVILYAAALAVLWSYSLRSDLVNGFDISTEYYDLQQTVLTGIWHAAHPGDAYAAMLSVTVMPAELHALSGIPALLVFKVVYPAIYALLPVAIFGLARKILSRPWAFVAAAFTVGQYAFAEIAGFARQEIALVLFAAAVASILEVRIQRRSQWALTALLGSAMVLSHYSTTYVAITVIGLAIPLQWVVSWFRKIPRATGAVVILFSTVLGGAVIWYGPVTHSAAAGLEQLAQTVEAQGPDILPNRVPGQSLISTFLNGNTKTPIDAARYAQLVHNYYQINKTYIAPLPEASLPRYALHNSAVPTPPVKWHLVYGILSVSLVLIVELGNVLCAIGALLMVLRRNTPTLARQIGLIALATVLLLTVLRVSGTLAVEYGQERAQLEGLVLLSVSLSWALQCLAGRQKRRQAGALAVTAVCLALLLANTTYLVGAVLGGSTADNVANSGEDFEQFYQTAPELASARWLGNNVRPGQLVYADEYGQLPLSAITGMTPAHGLITDLTPLTLNQHAWVYANRTNVIDGRAFALYKHNLATYIFPSGFLDANYGLVYTDGSSEVFHR